MSSAYPLTARRTPSVLRKTTTSLSDATAALATTKATVALSGLSLAQVRLTQNLPGMGQDSLRRMWYSGWLIDTSGLPVSRHHAGRSSGAAGSVAVTFKTAP